MGKTVRRSSSKTWMGQSTELGMSNLFIENEDCF